MEMFWKIAVFGSMAFRKQIAHCPLDLREAALKTHPHFRYEEDPFEVADLQTAYLLWSTP
jgi:hypothetical protein